MACCGHTSQSCGHRWSRCPACLELCEENQCRRWKNCCFLHAPLPSNCSSLVGSYQFVRTCRSLLCLIFMCAGLPENVRLRSYWKNIPEHPHDVILQCKTQMIKKDAFLSLAAFCILPQQQGQNNGCIRRSTPTIFSFCRGCSLCRICQLVCLQAWYRLNAK